MKLTKTLMALGLVASSLAHADINYNQVSFSSEVRSEIANDEMHATLKKTAQAKDAASLAKELNGIINNALQIAKRYPEVQVSTGRQNTYPRYDEKNNNKIIGFTGSASLELRSKDFEKSSQLIADLQSILVMEDLNFGVSDATREKEEKQLQTKAIKRFGDEAQSIATAFGASGYKIVNVQLGSSNHYYARPMAMAASLKTMDTSIEAPSFESGNTTLSYTTSGTIELIK